MKLRKLVPERLARSFELWRRRGRNHRCPYCGGRWKKLDKLGLDRPVIAELRIVGAGRRRARCPRCRSTDRERLLLSFFREKTRLFRDRMEVLHVAPERNLSVLLRDAPNLGYTAGDKFEPRSPSHITREKAEPMDVTSLAFANESFDVVICNHVLEHVPDDRKAMAEILRVLRPGGWALLQVPYSTVLEKTDEDSSVATPEERELRFGQFDHVRVYALEDYVARLESVGFEVHRDRHASELDATDREQWAIDPREELFVARRR
ncbi:MAG: methyltransferase domain-containing protein [Myxococcota bacterium]|nr:methyltransferase domain-containing protein [Myxococcota bacterium]